MEYYAHKRELPYGSIQTQALRTHMENTAQYACDCLKTVGLANAAYLAGLLHDMGKYTEAFQQYLERGDSRQRGTVIHTFQGCRYLMERYHSLERNFADIVAAEVIAYAIGAHHGLFDCVDETNRIGLLHRVNSPDTNYDEAKNAFLNELHTEQLMDELFAAAAQEINEFLVRMEEQNPADSDFTFSLGLLTRLLLSALIEGDRRDTAAFMHRENYPLRQENTTQLWSERLRHLEQRLQSFPSDTAIAQARQTISDRCREFAKQPPGIYRLNVPTGGGKTLSSLRYAISHAKEHHKKRIIFTSPLLSILEQNAGIIHDFLGDDSLILEHHSNVVQTPETQAELDMRELLVDSWDAPIIITTMVQLFNTMFDGRTGAIRRFHALCDAVLVIDEVQTVPPKLLTMFNLAISFLSQQCGTTVILCSATQPALEHTQHPIIPQPKDVIPYDASLWEAFKRTEISPLSARRLDEMPEMIRQLMADNESMLVVCNMKGEAEYLFRETQAQEYKSFHLSAAMCMQHRRDTVNTMKAALGAGQKVLCIATQVIEAGVDISFGCVVRLTAGMDSVVQAAGRCNRNGESNTSCPVYVVECLGEKLGRLRDIQRAKTASLRLLNEFQCDPDRFSGDLASDSAIKYYYKAFYREMNENEQDYPISEPNTTLFDLLSLNSGFAVPDIDGLESFALWQAFKTAGRQFTVFDDSTTDIIVPYGRGRDLTAQLFSERCCYDLAHKRAILKELSAYTVSVYSYQRKRLEGAHAINLIGDESVLVLSDGFYDENTGLITQTSTQEFWEV